MNELFQFHSVGTDRVVLAAEGLSLFRAGAGQGSVPLRMEVGESWAICGPPDSGRTRLLEILTGLGTVAAGAISILGRPIEDWPVRQLRQQVAWLRHDPWFLCRTVRQEVACLRHFIDKKAQPDGALDLLEQIAPWLMDRLATDPRDLATDEKLALDIVRRIHAGASMLLIDELPIKAPAQRVSALLGRVARRSAQDGLVLVIIAENPFGLRLDSVPKAAFLWGGEVRVAAPLEALRLREKPFELVRFLHDLRVREIGT